MNLLLKYRSLTITLATTAMLSCLYMSAVAQSNAPSDGDEVLMTPDMLKQKAKEVTPPPATIVLPEVNNKPQEKPAESAATTPEPAKPAEQQTPENKQGQPIEAQTTEAKPQEAKPQEQGASTEQPKAEQKSDDKAQSADGAPASVTSTEQAKEKSAQAPAEKEKDSASKGAESALPALTPPSANDGQNKDAVIEKDTDILAAVGWKGSLMFNNNDLYVLKTARQISLKTKGADGPIAGEDGLKLSDQEMAAANKGPREIHTPLLALGTIAYFDASHWSIWVNGKKYSAGDKLDDVEIVEVTRDKVTFSWTALSLDLFFPEWKNVSSIDGDKRVIKRGNNNIYIDDANMRISFSLYPNQTFVGRDLDIVEGHTMNESGYDVVPVAAAENQNVIDKVLDDMTPKKDRPAKPN